MTTNLQSWGPKRYISGSGIASGTAALALIGGARSTSLPTNRPFFPLARAQEGDRDRGFTMQIFGTTASATGTFLIYRYKRCRDPFRATNPPGGMPIVFEDWDIKLLHTGTFALAASALKGATNDLGCIRAAEFIASTIAVTEAVEGAAPYGIGFKLRQARPCPQPQVYSPGGILDEAMLWVPECDNAEGIVLDATVSAGSVNFLLEAGT